MPDFPWRLAGCPQLFQHRLVAQGVHRVPETAMLEGHHLAHRGEPDDRRTFPRAVVAIDQLEAAWRQHEIAAVNEAAVTWRLFDEGFDGIAVSLQRAVTSRRAHRSDGRKPAVGQVKIDRRADIEVA